VVGEPGVNGGYARPKPSKGSSMLKCAAAHSSKRVRQTQGEVRTRLPPRAVVRACRLEELQKAGSRRYVKVMLMDAGRQNRLSVAAVKCVHSNKLKPVACSVPGSVRKGYAGT